ncbi:MAG: signal peptidase I, partial [Elusimicrobia bacterium]|nr:signal peptidase I [Elusimicrobiota bacterium]
METSPARILAVRGDSMRPLLKAGDLILVRRAALSELSPGDLVVLMDWRGEGADCVVHRLFGRAGAGGSLRALTKGDANLLPDPPTPESGIVGAVAA